MNFSCFHEGLFLEAPQVVLFHATALHCHHGMDVDKASLFVIGLPPIQSSSQPEKIEKRMSELSSYKKSSQDEEFVA